MKKTTSTTTFQSNHLYPFGQVRTLADFPQQAQAALAQSGISHPGSITTQQAANYLTQLGVPTAKSSLEVFRCQSRGPKYKKIGNRVFYTKEWLDEYAQGIEIRIFDPSEN
jgi:hypothetical protein